jgi:hypothetical protein
MPPIRGTLICVFASLKAEGETRFGKQTGYPPGQGDAYALVRAWRAQKIPLNPPLLKGDFNFCFACLKER